MQSGACGWEPGNRAHLALRYLHCHEPEPCQSPRSIGLAKINSWSRPGVAKRHGCCGDSPRSSAFAIRLFETFAGHNACANRPQREASDLEEASIAIEGGQMDPHKPITDSTDLLRGICDAQLSADSIALAKVLRDAAEAEDAGNECHRGPAKSQLRRPERGPGLRAARLARFDGQPASR